MLAVTGTTNGDVFEAFDPQGRLLCSRTLNAATALLPCPAGIVLWRITSSTGARWNGKVLVP
jgi:hypothetical protein